MGDTFRVFDIVCDDVHKAVVIRNLRRVFSEVISLRDNVVYALIRALEDGNVTKYDTIMTENGSVGESADERIRSILLKWCITGDCTSPR